VFGLFRYGWGAEEATGIEWHTNDPDTDPWMWRIRVLDERNDISYGKVFFKKAGYITREWAPYFLAARRGTLTFQEEYAGGTLSQHAKRIYETVAEHGALPSDGIKHFAGFSREEKSKFDRALTELQMKLYLTICGEQVKITKTGEPYGLSSTVLCTFERFWGEDAVEAAARIGAEGAVAALTARIWKLNPSADAAKIGRFIRG
jgi:hypothetical protein